MFYGYFDGIFLNLSVNIWFLILSFPVFSSILDRNLIFILAYQLLCLSDNIQNSRAYINGSLCCYKVCQSQLFFHSSLPAYYYALAFNLFTCYNGTPSIFILFFLKIFSTYHSLWFHFIYYHGFNIQLFIKNMYFIETMLVVYICLLYPVMLAQLLSTLFYYLA